MTDRQPWEIVVDAETAYIEARMLMFRAGAEHQLGLAMDEPDGRTMALRVLREAPFEMALPLLGSIFRVAIGSGANVGIAREVIGKMPYDVIGSRIDTLVNFQLDRPEADWEDYRRIAELLVQLDDRALLKTVVDRARVSTDPDIREIVEEYENR